MRKPFELELRAVAQNVYVVNEKMPNHGYDRKWRLHVLWRDGSTSGYVGDDSPEGFERIHRQALRDPRAVADVR